MSATVSDDSHAVAQAVHDLGSALWFGGSVFGFAAVNTCGEDLKDPLDRVRVANSAWSRFGPVEWAGLLANAAAGLQLTSSSSGRVRLQQGFRRAGTVKVAVTALGAAATAYATYTGRKVGQLTEEAARRGDTFEVHDATVPTDGTPPEVATWQRRQRQAQWAVPVLSGANVVLNSYLVQSYRPVASAKGVLGRLRPV